MSAPGAKRKLLSISEKAQILRELENGSSNQSICKKYNLSASTVSTFLRNKETIQRAFNNNITKRKKLRKCVKNDVDAALLAWFKAQRSAGLPVNGPILKVQAEKFAQLLGYKDFECNNGWIDRFKNRNNIVYSKGSFEASAFEESSSSSSDWLKNDLRHIQKNYKEDDVYFLEEFGLVYDLIPDNVQKFKNGTLISGNRVTVVMSSNITGSDKRRLLVIGKFPTPECLGTVKKLPVDYVTNQDACLNSNIFVKEIQKWDQTLRKTKRNVLLLTRASPVHPYLVSDLTNVQLAFWPPNLSITRGVIRNFKTHFRGLFLIKLLEYPEIEAISALQAVRFLNDAWDVVSSETIKNCFKDDVEDENTRPLLSQWLKSRNIDCFFNYADIDEFASVDDETATSGDPLQVTESLCDENHTDILKSEILPDVTWSEAESALAVLSDFLESRSDSPDESFRLLSSLRNSFVKMKYEPV